MRILIIAFLLLPQLVHSLQPGKRYNFYCGDGNVLINAELIAEDAERYYLKLSASVDRVRVEKRIVLRIEENVNPLKASRSRWHADALVGAGLALGKLGEFSRTAPTGLVSLNYAALPRIALLLRMDLTQYTRDASYLRIAGLTAGVAVSLPLEFLSFRFSSGASAGTAYLYAVADVYRAQSLVPMAALWGLADRTLTPRLSFLFQLQLIYLYDRETFTLLPGILAGARYQL